MVQPAIPEVFEDQLHSSIGTRTEALQTLRELGPPDLVHLVKQPPKSPTKTVGVYHHVTGIDASSSASLAAYVNTLIFSPNEKTNKVVSGVYCCYNAFSRVDMRVQVNIPGTVESYCIDERGDKRVATEALWLEAYLCGVLRAYSYADDGSGNTIKRIVGMRRFNPITNTESEHKFLDATERLFFKGWQLGSDPEVQVPNLVSNHLTTGLLDYVSTTGRYTSGINLFEKLRTREVEVSSLLARTLIAADEEVRAIALLHEAVEILPMDYALLDVQASFLMSKNRHELALQCAKRSVIAAPSEFSTWARLAEIYVISEQWELALLTLNSCPMFTYQDKDGPRMPEPTRVALPVLSDSLLDEIDDDGNDEMDLVRPTLRNLPAANYKGTFLKAYSLLTEVTKKIGWDQLLRIRSRVFVMEEEYRTEKQATTQPVHSRNASTTAFRGTPSPRPSENGTTGAPPDEKDHENASNSSTITDNAATMGESKLTDAQTSSLDGNTLAAEDSIERPELTVSSQEVKSGNEDVGEILQVPDGELLTKKPDPSHSQYTQFRHKRLCERWLDNLFMVLYEDLRVYTIWRTELAQYRQQSIQYKKSAEEWEIYGALAERLKHHDEAAEAWQMCLATRFSPKAMRGLLSAAETHHDGRAMLDALIRLVAWQYRWYSEFSPSLLKSIRRLIEDEGAVKVRSIIQATSLPQPVLDLTHHYAALCAAFRSNGSDG